MGESSVAAHADLIRGALSTHLPELKAASSQALAAVLGALDDAVRKAERDERLRRKFCGAPSPKSDDASDEWETVEGANSSAASPVSSLIRRPYPSPDADAVMVPSNGNPGGTLGNFLAERAVSLLSSRGAEVSTGIAAAAAAAHALLLLDRGDGPAWECTGIQNDNAPSAPVSGFADPVRALRTLFPAGWDAGGSTIRLRYWRRNVRAKLRHPYVMRAELRPHRGLGEAETPGDTICLSFGRAGDDAAHEVRFGLGTHVNLPSLAAATVDGRRVGPALHYVALAGLLGRVAEAWDMVWDAPGADPIAPATIALVAPPAVPPTMNLSGLSAGVNQVARPSLGPFLRGADPLRFSGVPQGDFDEDLRVPVARPFLPLGIHGPGSLMGPDHPIFGGETNGMPRMAPRFDPYTPVGNGDDRPFPGSLGPRRPNPVIGGNPNHDHLRMPGGLGGNADAEDGDMFM
eukprot:CAMPEP_0194285584 /NCGR_PEP_ID=MMETSP0169-20130528/30534_1 /TAXON_ID=218684 /ORGANISM="Corethron pennatum, Strain L29A3" /LENGTH=460 /DNA_ID=CAMNT_0039031749 /DNA_START=141 /DNA_END=1523 /DNA_ORIENTATION=-